MTSANDIIQFWFHEISPGDRWKKSDAFDALIRERFTEVHTAAAQGELFSWRTDAEGRLAEIIVLDQFSRNMFRDSAESFASDPMALVLSQEAIVQQSDAEMDDDQRAFLYMPLMHSESLVVHELALKMFSQLESEGYLGFEKKHLAIIERFGRYPHRNEILGRSSTSEEVEFLKGPGSSF